MKTNKYIDAISTHIKATPVFCRDYEMGDYYVWDLCEFKFSALFDNVKHLSLYMFNDYFVLSFGNYWNGTTLKLDDLKGMFALLELDKGEITEYDQYDHYVFCDTSYEEPCYIDERLLRLMIAALEENKA